MYRWQTITLARVEHNRSTFGTNDHQVAAIKRFLLDIGLQHFPEPELSYPPDKVVMSLRWFVDDRELRVDFNPYGRVVIDRASRGEDGSGGHCTGAITPNGDDVHSAVRWLLFGTKPEADMIEGGTGEDTMETDGDAGDSPDADPVVRIQLLERIGEHSKGAVLNVAEATGKEYVNKGFARYISRVPHGAYWEP